MKKKAPLISDQQIEDLLRHFSAYGSVPDSEEKTGAADVFSSAHEQEQPSISSDDAEKKAPDHDRSQFVKKARQDCVGQSKPTFRILVLSCILIIFTWLLPSANVMGLRPASDSAKDRDSFFQMSAQHLMSDTLKEVHVIPRKYYLEMSDTLTPEPDATKFKRIFDTERQNYDGEPIYYYEDDSIEVKCWKELIDENVFNFSEIWISDPSQLRRTLVDNVISKKHRDHPQNIFAKTNGVVGMTADYCAFRDYGTIIQYGDIIRASRGSNLDIAVYDRNGNFSAYSDRTNFAESELYLKGQIIHTFAFGPVLVDDYKASDSYKITLTNKAYPGELNLRYPRAAICQFGYEKHYLLCTVDYRGLTAKEFSIALASKGVRFAYNLDGGQTATLMFNKEIINKVAYGGTREVSDILYFATAIPND